MPKVSVVVPVYNAENYLDDCITSIQKQTFSDFELILIDDGSTDNSGKICDNYAENDNRIIVKHISNSGVSVVRNIAIEMISGKYVTFCDSDDTYDPDLLMDSISTIEKYQVDCVSFKMKRILLSGEIEKNNYWASGYYEFPSKSERIDYIINNFLRYAHGWSMSNHIFCTDIIKNNNIKVCTSCKNYAEDLGFVCEYLMHTKNIYCMDNAYYNYYERVGSMMSQSKNVIKLDSMNEITKHLYNRFEKIFNTTAEKNAYSVIFYVIMYKQYEKLMVAGLHKNLPAEINKIDDLNWYKLQTKTIIKNYKYLKKYFSKTDCQRILLFTTYCIHQNWKLYSVCSAIYYKFFYKEKRVERKCLK